MHATNAQGRIATQGLRLPYSFLSYFLFLAFIPSAHADMSCPAFHGLLGYIQAKHLRQFSPEEYQHFYLQGLATAVTQLQKESRSLNGGEITALLKPHLDPADYFTCRDSQIIADAFAKSSRKNVNPGTVLGLQIKGIVRAMDPHSDYYPQAEWGGVWASATSAKLGFRMRQVANRIEVEHVYPQGPADGVLLPGDQILTATRIEDDRRLGFVGASKGQVSSFFTGVEGDEFRLTILRSGKEEQAMLSMSVDSGSRVAEAQVRDGGSAYIKLTDFNRGAADDFAEALQWIMQKGAQTLTIDLRENPGGAVSESVKILDMLLGTGVAVQLLDRKGIVEKERMVDSGMSTEMPVTLLLNRFSASASELMAIALKDYERALLVGEQTFGKGTAQLVLSPQVLQDEVDRSIDGGLRLTMYQYFGPSGQSPQLVGVAPHVRVRDAQYERQLEVRRSNALASGYVYVEGETDYTGALVPSRSIAPIFENVMPTNNISWILSRLMPLLPSALNRVTDIQLEKSLTLMGVYRDNCASYHRTQCGFETVKGTAVASSKLP